MSSQDPLRALIESARVLTHSANQLTSNGLHDKAVQKYAVAWEIWGVKLADRPELEADRATLLVNWAVALQRQGQYKAALEKYAAAWKIHKQHLRQSRSSDPLLFKLARGRQSLWGHGHGWALEVSAEMCRCLAEQNQANPPHWLGELHSGFARFHLRWMQDSLQYNKPEQLVQILSRVSSWRMATALLDELETATAAQASDKDGQALQTFQRLRLQVRRISQQLQEKEQAAGVGSTDISGLHNRQIRAFGQAPLPATLLTQLQDDIHALRAQYDTAYNAMQQAQALAASVPGYTALSVVRTDLDSQTLLATLKPDQAMLIAYDQRVAATANEAEEHLSGVLLLRGKDRSVHWHPIEDMATGHAFLREFERLIDPQQTKHMTFGVGEAGAEEKEEEAAAAQENEAEGAFGAADFRLGDVKDPGAVQQTARPALVYAGTTIGPDNLWPSLGQWIKDVLWQPLQAQGLWIKTEEGEGEADIRELILITQGQDAHSIPWHMGSGVKATAIHRYPGLMFYAMDADRISRAACSDEPSIGIAHYHGSQSPLPFARIEAHRIQEIWQSHQRATIATYNHLRPQGHNPGFVHVAGHGSHVTHAANPAKTAKTAKAATACLLVGDDERWGLAQLMASPARPGQVYLSCCVAGRTTDIAGEQYGITAALLQHGAREVVASSVTLDDIWGSTLSIITHSLMSTQRLSLKEALNRAQDMVTGTVAWDDWDAQAREMVLKGWEGRLDQMGPMSQVLQPLLIGMLEQLQNSHAAMRSEKAVTKAITIRMNAHVLKHLSHQALLQFDTAKYRAWCDGLGAALRNYKGDASPADLAHMAWRYAATLRQAMTWKTQAPALIAGSLAHATFMLGRRAAPAR